MSSRWERSSSLTMDEWNAIHRDHALAIREGAEWTDCPNCFGGLVTTNLGPLTLCGSCTVCVGTGRVLAAEAAQAAEAEKGEG